MEIFLFTGSYGNREVVSGGKNGPFTHVWLLGHLLEWHRCDLPILRDWVLMLKRRNWSTDCLSSFLHMLVVISLWKCRMIITREGLLFKITKGNWITNSPLRAKSIKIIKSECECILQIKQISVKTWGHRPTN